MRRILSLAAATSVVLLAFLGFLLIGSGRHAEVVGGADDPPDVTMDQASYSAAVGDTFHVLIDVTGLGVANCSHYQFEFTYLNTLVNIIASTPDEATGCVNGLTLHEFDWYYPSGDDALVDCGDQGTPVPADPAFTDPQQIVDFTFECLQQGDGTLGFGDIYLVDGAGNGTFVTNTFADVHCTGAGEPTSTPTETPTPTCTTNPTDTPTATSTPSPTGTPNPTNTPTQTPVATATPTSTATLTPTNTPVATNSPTATIIVRHRRTPTPVPTDTPAPPTSTPIISTPLPPAATSSPVGGAGPVITGPSTGTGSSGDSASWLPATWLLLVVGTLAIAAGTMRWRARQ